MYLIHNGDCLDVMATLPANSVDSIVTDPPYGLSFMGKDWDHGVPGEHFWAEALRVAKPGAYLLAFGGTRTHHRLACAIEDAGWEIRDCLGWLYSSGFPKSHNISKALDKVAGAEREVVGVNNFYSKNRKSSGEVKWSSDGHTFSIPGDPEFITAPATGLARQWDGWGTALKPAWEPIVMARKPLVGTVAQNVTEWGTGGINIDGCRVGCVDSTYRESNHGASIGYGGSSVPFTSGGHPAGRFPANILHDGSEEVLSVFPNDSSRFFYCAKASKSDRNDGLDGFEERRESDRVSDDGVGGDNPRNRTNQPRKNHHPTVKPTDLMAYCCRLVTPPNGVVLDPFMGSGSTGRGAVREGFDFIGIDLDADYCAIAEARIQAEVDRATETNTLFS